LGELVSGHRLVTLTGTGDVGKSPSAHRVAAECVDGLTGGRYWVELAPAATAEGVLAQVASGVGLVLQPDAPPPAQLVAHLNRVGASLVVLDNSEHVVAAPPRWYTNCSPLARRCMSRPPAANR
jgi:predicted ATPase